MERWCVATGESRREPGGPGEVGGAPPDLPGAGPRPPLHHRLYVVPRRLQVHLVRRRLPGVLPWEERRGRGGMEENPWRKGPATKEALDVRPWGVFYGEKGLRCNISRCHRPKGRHRKKVCSLKIDNC